MFNSTGILATVTNIAPIIINSLPDSIKTISLSNGKEIIISKNNGFYKLFSFRDFPTNSADGTADPRHRHQIQADERADDRGQQVRGCWC